MMHFSVRIWKFYRYLALSNVLFISGQMLRGRTPFWDYCAAFALLGFYILLALALTSLLLAFIVDLFDQMGIHSTSRFVEAVLFSILVMSWGNLLRMVLASRDIQPSWLPARLILLASFAIGFVVFVAFRARLAVWIAGLLKMAAILSTAVVLFWISVIAVFIGVQHKKMNSYRVTVARQASVGPNVICIVLDALAARDMSLYGYPLHTTPYLEELAKTWTVYDRAFSAGTGTSANLPAVMTGRYPVLSPPEHYGDLPRGTSAWPNLLDLLRGNGYETVYIQGGIIGPNFHHMQFYFDKIVHAGLGWYLTSDPLSWCSRINPALWDFFFPNYFPVEWILPTPFSFGRTRLIEPMYDRAIQFLQHHAADNDARPVFIYMHMLRPHAPYLANEDQGVFLPLSQGMTSIRGQLPFLGFPRRYAPDEESSVKKLRLRYDENILRADQDIRAFIAKIKSIGWYDSSMIIVMADHGTNFTGGVVGYYTDQMRLAEHLIPLLIKYPGQTVGARIPEFASTVDVMPTVLDVAGIRFSTASVDGTSLFNRPPGRDKDRLLFVCNAAHVDTSYAAISGDMKLVQYPDATRALFNIKRDPEETTNLFGKLDARRLENALESFAEHIRSLRASVER
jgi:arylsulfatase A-like enzyme